MENGIFTSGWIEEIAIVASVVGIVYLIGDKMEGGMGKFLSIACSLVISFYLLSPLVGFVRENEVPDLDDTLGDITVEGESAQHYYQALSKAAIESLEVRACTDIENQLDIGMDEFTLHFDGGINQESFILDNCNITLKTVNALSKRNEIEKYIKQTYGCKCRFYEMLF